MKTLKLVLIATLFFATIESKSQVSVNVNIGTPPVWAPSAPVEVAYYYLPDIEVYYDVPARRYIYLRNGRWFRSAALPAHCRGYNLRNGRVIYLRDYHGSSPYILYNEHRIKYGRSNYGKTKKWEGNFKPGKGHGHGRGHGH